MKDKEKIREIKSSCNELKSELIDIAYELEEAGGIKEAKQLRKIIGRLEGWQNK